ncbi:MAG: aminotransferase class V-fold PLP-dependent enzyme [Spirochaetales bacterium]|nr:aminotransferase class V-fold PLP-dependent enzyme [Spirochaetales bacterium]
MGCNCEVKKRLTAMARDFQGDPVYLDYNATTPTDPRLLRLLDTLIRRQWGNPASLHLMGGEASLREEETRRTAARIFRKGEKEFHFCSSGCEGISGLLSGTVARYRTLITTGAEHSVLLQSAEHQFNNRNRLLSLDRQGKIDLAELEELFQKVGPSILFYSPVNHETGARQDCEAIFRLAQKAKRPVFIDGVQAAYRLSPEEWAPYCHGFVISGHKLHVPKGIGLVWLDPAFSIEPFRWGGSGAELFPGTANLPGIALLGKGLELLEEEREAAQISLKTLTAEAEQILSQCRTRVIRESPADSVPGVLCLSLPEVKDWEEFFLHLGERRVCVSRFSACTGTVEGDSLVLTAMGVPSERASSSLRISFGRMSKRQDFFALKEAIDSYVQTT